MRITTVLCVLGMASALSWAANAPWVGKWKLNPAKSQLTGETVTMEKTAAGMMRFASGDESNTFNVDGKEYPTADGGTTQWKALDANTWDVTNRFNGKVMVTYKLSLKGDTLAVATSIKKADGGTVDESVTAARVSGGPGFLGKWKTTQVKTGGLSLELAANGSDGITFTSPEEGWSCSGKFDGKDCSLTGALEGSKMTLTFKKTGSNSFELTEKTAGKPTYVESYTVSADGKTLTVEGSAVSKKEPVKSVYDRQ